MIYLNFSSFTSSLIDSIKDIKIDLNDQQKKVIAAVGAVFALITIICIVSRCCSGIKGKKKEINKLDNNEDVIKTEKIKKLVKKEINKNSDQKLNKKENTEKLPEEKNNLPEPKIIEADIDDEDELIFEEIEVDNKEKTQKLDPLPEPQPITPELLFEDVDNEQQENIEVNLEDEDELFFEDMDEGNDVKEEEEVKPVLTPEEIAKAEELEELKAKLIQEYTPQMVQALGGIDEFLKIPEIDSKQVYYGAYLKSKESILRGYIEGSPCLYFQFDMFSDQDDKGNLGPYFEKRKECILIHKGKWMNNDAYAARGQLFLCTVGEIKQGSSLEKYMLSRIERLRSKQVVGLMRLYNEKFFGYKPPKIDVPADAYLTGEELEEYMKLPNNYYEAKPNNIHRIRIK